MTRPLVGAYDYLWNPENFSGGTLRGPSGPAAAAAGVPRELEQPRTVARDITNACRAGIDFFAVDWWPYDPGYSGRDYQQADVAMGDFLRGTRPQSDEVRDVLRDLEPRLRSVRESTPVTFQMELHFDADMLSFAERYFPNRSYLRIDGRPVVFLYLTRTLTGDVAGMIRGARTVLESTGLRPVLHR